MLRAGMVAPDETTFNYLKGRFRTEIRLVRDCRFGWLDFPRFHSNGLLQAFVPKRERMGQGRTDVKFERTSILQTSLYSKRMEQAVEYWKSLRTDKGAKLAPLGLCFMQYSLSGKTVEFSVALASFTKQQRREV